MRDLQVFHSETMQVSHIAPALDTLQSTPSERTAMMLCFSMAAASVCWSSYVLSNHLLSSPWKINLPVALGTGLVTWLSIRYRQTQNQKALQKIQTFQPARKHQKKINQLRDEAKAYSMKLGLQQAPELCIIRDKSAHFHAAVGYDRTHSFVVFPEHVVSKNDLSVLRLFMGHEAGHLGRKHELQTQLFSLLQNGSWLLAGAAFFSASSLLYALPALLSAGVIIPVMRNANERRCEFEADRIATVLVNDPRAVRQYVDQFSLPSLSMKEWLDYPPGAERKVKMTKAALCLPVRIGKYALFETSPNDARREERLLTIHNPPKYYNSDTLSARLSQLILG